MGKRLFLLAGVSCSGKSTLCEKYKSDTSIPIFGDLTKFVAWQISLSPSPDGRKISFRTGEHGIEQAEFISIADLRGDVQITDAPDGLLLHVDLFTLARVSQVKAGQQSEVQIRREYEKSLEKICSGYDEIIVSTIDIDRRTAAKRYFRRAVGSVKSRGFSVSRQAGRAWLGAALKYCLNEETAMKVYAILLGRAAKHQIFILDDGQWFNRIQRVWATLASEIATRNFIIRCDEKGISNLAEIDIHSSVRN